MVCFKDSCLINDRLRIVSYEKKLVSDSKLPRIKIWYRHYQGVREAGVVNEYDSKKIIGWSIMVISQFFNIAKNITNLQ